MSNFIFDDLMSIVSNNIDGDSRKELFHKLYFKIIISISEPTFADIARNSGYTTTTVTRYIKKNKDLFEIMEKNYNTLCNSDKFRFEPEDNKTKINRVHNQLVINHISKVKKSYNNYRRFSEKERKRIIDRIVEMYQ